MNIDKAYNIWAEQYDTNENKTRDLEGIALRTILADNAFENCLEIGCGTGKNTEWLMAKAKKLTAVDFSTEMLQKAKNKIQNNNVHFVQADITQPWDFATTYDLITFSLVLEHIENLQYIFDCIEKHIQPNGLVYIGELHPFKQYNGSKAKFETDQGTEVLTCFIHHISDFTNLAAQKGFEIIELQEFFDNNDRSQLPRILTILLKKNIIKNYIKK